MSNMATKAKVATTAQGKKPVVSTKLVASSPTGRPVPNYLKPTFSSKPEITSKYVKKSSVVHNDDSSAQKARIQRVRSFDKSPVGTSRVKPVAASTHKPGGSRPVKLSLGPTRTKKAPHPVPPVFSSAPESLSTSPTKCIAIELVYEEDTNANGNANGNANANGNGNANGNANTIIVEQLTEKTPVSVDNDVVRADEPVDNVSNIAGDKNLTYDDWLTDTVEDLESDILLKEEEIPITAHAEEETPEKIILANEEIHAENGTDAEQLKEETNESPTVDEDATEAEPAVEVKEEPRETVEKSEASAVQKKQVVQAKKEAPSAYNDVIEETKNKLLEKKKNKVKALVGAFETVIDYESASK